MTMLQHGSVPSTGGYQIERSLRFNSADSAYLSRTPASNGNRKTWTWSAWVKKTRNANGEFIFSAGPSSPRSWFIFDSSDRLDFRAVDSSNSDVVRVISTPVYRDNSSWYHIVIALDTSQATSSDRFKMYVNGVQITALSTATYPSLNKEDLAVNAALEHRFGNYVHSPGDGYLACYMADAYFIDGSALTPSSFGETDTDTGVWKPKAYSGTYGTNGFYLKFADNSGTTSTTLGKDSSGNGNNWTPNNFSVTAGAGNDSLVDTPTPYGSDTGAGGNVRGNYCTLNPIDKNSGDVVKNGNLDAEVAGYRAVVGTVAVTSGKWYWEVTPTGNSGSLNYMLGIADANSALTTRGWTGANGWYYFYDGRKFNNSTGASYGASYTTNDVIGVALDMDAGTVTFYKNGSSQGQAYSGLTGKAIQPSVSDGSSSSFQYYTCNFGQRPFAYTAPSGFKALCTTNLPTPAIGATSATRADDYFGIATYAGTGSTNTITTGIDVASKGGLVWFKARNGAFDHHIINNVAGYDKFLSSNKTDAENTYSFVTSTSSTGLSINGGSTNVNGSGYNYVAWNWAANGTGSSNTQGTITSTVSANTTSGFSIVTYTGNGAAGPSVGHGLGAVPEMIILKQRASQTNYNWFVYHKAIGNTQYLLLNSSNGASSGVSAWNNTTPTSNVFTIGSYDEVNRSGSTFVAYCFAPVVGYSAFGSYVGTNTTDGAFVYTGFRPAFLMIKTTANFTAGWVMIDAKRNTYNVLNAQLYPDQSAAESTSNFGIDFLSNGFKMRNADNYANGSGLTYIYAAFAENPFKYSLAR